jgi:opacity protein-like surface antigen
MRKFLLTICSLALFGFAATEANAQVSFGAHASWASDVDLGVGARASFTLPVENLTIVPSFDFHFPGNGVSWMEFSANAHYDFPLADNPGILPYAGGGLNHIRSKVEFSMLGISESYTATATGLNLLGGVKFPQFGKLVPFGELRYGTAGTGQIYLTGGVIF